MSLTLPWLVPQAIAIWVWLAPVYWLHELEQPPDGAGAQGGDGLGPLPERVRDHE